MKRILKTLSTCLLLITLMHTPVFAAPKVQFTTDDLTSAFIYKISKFVIWPKNAFQSDTERLQVCFLSHQPKKLARHFEKFIGDKKVQNHFFSVYDVSGRDPVKQLIESAQRCHIIYSLDALQKDKLLLIKKNYSSSLIMGTGETFLRNGGMLSLIKVSKKFKIYINPISLKQSRIKLETRLLSVAKAI